MSASPMPVVIAPGFHARSLTQQFVRSLPPFVQPHVIDVFPANPIAVFHWLMRTFGSPQPNPSQASRHHQPQPSLVAIGFSAGVVGLAGALSQWQQQGGSVARFFAMDGWGVPIVGLPVCRLSHDYFTHWSSLLLGGQEINFYADPPVAHLEMWGAAEQVMGQQATGWIAASEELMTAADFLRRQLTLEYDKLSK
jgi:hypothetical protein